MAEKTDKLDLYKQHKEQYVAARKPVLIDVPAVPYLAIDGQGEPGGQEFQAKVGGLYAVAFTIKMTRKFAGRGDYKVCHLEGLWGLGTGGAAEFLAQPRRQWRWRLLIRVPEFITRTELEAAKQALRQKGKPPEFEQVALKSIKEGRCVQMLHVGPYATEGQTLAKMEELAGANGLALAGPHHEIYLSDPRRVPPERLRTILRQPVHAS